jgi:protein CpxP
MRRAVVMTALLVACAAPLRPRASVQQPRSREALERRVRQAFSRMIRERVGLDEPQMRQLADVNRRMDGDRRRLLREERETRRTLRSLMTASGAADQVRIDGHLKQLLDIQRRRMALNESEQRELAKFMTPLQRARYSALQEQVRRRLEEIRRNNPQNRLSDDSMPRGGARPR